MPYFFLAVAAVAPIILIAIGKRFLGSQTHPAAIFILAWMLCGFLLGSVPDFTLPTGAISLVWVAVCFTIITLWQKRAARRARSATTLE